MEIILDDDLIPAPGTTLYTRDEAKTTVKEMLTSIGISTDIVRDVAVDKIVGAVPDEYLAPRVFQELDYIAVLKQLVDNGEVAGLTEDDVTKATNYYVDKIFNEEQARNPDVDEQTFRNQVATAIQQPVVDNKIPKMPLWADLPTTIRTETNADTAAESSDQEKNLIETGMIGGFETVINKETGQVTRIYTAQDFQDLFAFSSDWQEPLEIFLNAQSRGYWPTKDMVDQGVTQPVTMFQWEDTQGYDPGYGTNAPVGVMGLRNAVREMPPAEVQKLVTKMQMAGIFEQIGGTPDRAFSGSDQWVQLGLNVLMSESLAGGGIGLNEVLRRRTNERVAAVNKSINDANISTVQSTLRQIGVQFLGRPLTEEEALSVLSGLEQLAPEFAEAQLALGYSPQEIIEDVETITEAEARNIGAQIEDRFKSQAIRWRAGNRARGLGEQFAKWKRGADQSVEQDMPLSGLQSSVETVSDVLGDTNGTA
jgi:hypothetical protein